MTEKNLAAVHEAGHIVVACLVDFWPESIRVTNEGNGELRLDYGDLVNIARVMMAMDICPEFSTFLHNLDRAAALELAERLCLILVAGGIAENISNVGLKYDGEIEVEYSGPDFTRAEAISKYFGIDLSQKITELYVSLCDTTTWNTIEALKEAILKSPGTELDRPAIDRILETSGFKAFLDQT